MDFGKRVTNSWQRRHILQMELRIECALGHTIFVALSDLRSGNYSAGALGFGFFVFACALACSLVLTLWLDALSLRLGFIDRYGVASMPCFEASPWLYESLFGQAS